jgi:hypothetical protein
MEETGNRVKSPELPWRIRNVYAIRTGIRLCIFISGLMLVLFLFSEEILFFEVAFEFIFIAIILYITISLTKGFADIGDELGEDLLAIKSMRWNIMRYITKTHGEFIIKQEIGGKFTSGYYILWIETPKNLPEIKDEDVDDLLKKNIFYSTHGDAPLSEFVPQDLVRKIRSLGEIRFQTVSKLNRIEARLLDNILIYGARDVLPTLRVLRVIEERLK